MAAERILRFRVERQLNDPVRNPEGRWSLIFSSNDIGNAEEFAEAERENLLAFGLDDKIRVRDGGSETVINRREYI